MRKLPTIGVCFCLFIFIIVAALFWMPDSYRIHPRLKMPDIVFLPSKVSHMNTRTILVGDSLASRAPWPYDRIVLPGRPDLFDKFLEHIVSMAPRFNRVDRVIIIWGTGNIAYGESYDTVAARLDRVEATIQSIWPDARIEVATPTELREISIEHNIGDGWHLDKTGYEILASRLFSEHGGINPPPYQ